MNIIDQAFVNYAGNGSGTFYESEHDDNDSEEEHQDREELRELDGVIHSVAELLEQLQGAKHASVERLAEEALDYMDLAGLELGDLAYTIQDDDDHGVLHVNYKNGSQEFYLPSRKLVWAAEGNTLRLGLRTLPEN